jgi:hypothetical protein
MEVLTLELADRQYELHFKHHVHIVRKLMPKLWRLFRGFKTTAYE